MALIAYTVAAGLLTLAVPLASQSLVNTIAAGVFLQPLFVLTAMVFLGLLFAGFIKVLQFSLVEILQQRVFARVAIRIAQQLPLVEHQALMSEYPPELVNRFFDVVKFQKTLAKLLLDGPAAVLQILVGMTLMAFYSPFLLAFNLVILFSIFFIAFVLGHSGLTTSLKESQQKYRVAGWLEDVARCQTSFKLDSSSEFALTRADSLVSGYLEARQSHFKVLFRQAATHYFFYAAASAGILGIGGCLVIDRQLTLGQLVASELVVVIVLAAMEKLTTLYQDWYDLLTAVEKIGHVTDLPIERDSGKILPSTAIGAKVVCRQVQFSYHDAHTPTLNGINLTLMPGQRVSLVGASGTGKTTLASLICGLMPCTSGSIEIDDLDLRDIDLINLRDNVALVYDSNGIFDGTIEENILCGRPNLTHSDLRQALEKTFLLDELTAFPEGLQTRLVSGGGNLSRGQIQQLMIARSIVDRPRLLILDEAFSGIDETIKQSILDLLYSPQEPWTILNISHDLNVISRSEIIYVMANGILVEAGSFQELLGAPESHFAQLFTRRRVY